METGRSYKLSERSLIFNHRRHFEIYFQCESNMLLLQSKIKELQEDHNLRCIFHVKANWKKEFQ